jgi:RHS repeat-associated protein
MIWRVILVLLLLAGNGLACTPRPARGFTVDAGNELTNVAVAGQWQSAFVYDGLGRRRIERDFVWQSGGWVPTNEVHYIYDGDLILQERDAGNRVLVTYTRGRDLGGGIQTAGGIGGLLARTDTNGSAFYHADGLGNVTALINSSNYVVARYLYNPFGQMTAKWGPYADVNEMQFSSMPHHNQSGFSMYLYRAYDPNLQRWLNRDPIGEDGGINLYGFVGNNPIHYYDPLGLAIGDNWDPRTWFNSGFSEAWSAESSSFTQTLADLATGNWNDIANQYDDSALGQAESIGGGVYTAEQYLLATAATATAGTFSLTAANATAFASHIAIHWSDDDGKRKPCPRAAVGSLDSMSQSGQQPDRGGLTKAGRSLTKHGAGSRPGNSAFPPANGNPQQINQTAQNVLDDILTDPNSTTTQGYRGRFGPTTEMMGSGGQGAVFNGAGDFIFFIE